MEKKSKARRRIYISLPITGRDIEKQRARAKELERRIIGKGMIPVNPFDIADGLVEDVRNGVRTDVDAEPSWYDYMAEDLWQLLQCDGAVFDHDSKSSYGCSIEMAVAQAIANSDKKKFYIYHTKEQWSDVKSKYII